MRTYHPFHLVDVSPWPLTGSLGAFLMLNGLTSWMHKKEMMLAQLGVMVVIFTMIQWWRDVSREAVFQGKHSLKVESGLRMGMALFIVSEIFFFFAFFWAFFHSSLSPNVEVGATWPPVSLNAINPYEVPLLNTTVLLGSGATITWAHMALLNSKHKEASISMMWTISLGALFSYLQFMEYNFSPFTMSDSVYGSSFYIATGFHGLHVLIGTIFIIITFLRHSWGHFTMLHHFGFEASAWYWHFVDVVWLLLFLSIYWWGY